MAQLENGTGDKVISPVKLAHVVLRTSNLVRMRDFYLTFLGATVTYQNKSACFLTYDDEHHRIAIIEVPETKPKVVHSCGLEHIAFTYSSLEALLRSYRQRKDHQIDPFWCINHGPTTSIYYKDPDGNKLEVQVDNFETLEEADAFMNSEAFVENPYGTDFDPDELLAKLREGVSETELKRRVEIGPRERPWGRG